MVEELGGPVLSGLRSWRLPENVKGKMPRGGLERHAFALETESIPHCIKKY